MWIAKLSAARALVCVAALLIVIGLSACPYVYEPRHDYPSEYPVAEPIGECANLNGTFENAGTGLNKSKTASALSDARLLSTLMLAPGLIPSDTQATTLRISGPALGLLEIEALSAGQTVSHVSMHSAPTVDGFIKTTPFANFVCFGGTVAVTNDPVTDSKEKGKYLVIVRFRRAKDGSLIVARERVYQDYIYGVDIARQWFRFQQVSVKPLPVVQ